MHCILGVGAYLYGAPLHRLGLHALKVFYSNHGNQLAPDVLCIAIHGRDQSEQYMLDKLVSPLAQHLGSCSVRFCLPRSNSSAWYAARAIDRLTPETNESVQTATKGFLDLISQEKLRHPQKPLLFVGFSQGASLLSELVLARPETLDAACILTGCRIGAETDHGESPPLRRLPVYASCGDADPWLPLDSFHRLTATLAAKGARLRTDIIPGRLHEIAAEEVRAVAEMLTSLAEGKSAL